jgi:hypothetical protein
VEAAQRSSTRVVDLADALGVAYLVQGRVAAENDRVRVTTTLVRGEDGGQLWTATNERARTELRSLQREVTAAIAGRVRLEVAPERLARLDRRQTANAAANDAYLHAVDPKWDPFRADERFAALLERCRFAKVEPIRVS